MKIDQCFLFNAKSSATFQHGQPPLHCFNREKTQSFHVTKSLTEVFVVNLNLHIIKCVWGESLRDRKTMKQLMFKYYRLLISIQFIFRKTRFLLAGFVFNTKTATAIQRSQTQNWLDVFKLRISEKNKDFSRGWRCVTHRE